MTSFRRLAPPNEQIRLTGLLIVGDFNYSNIAWHYASSGGASAWYGHLSDNDTKFINAIRENLFIQHVVEPTRQRGTDTPHTLDLVISSDDFFI